MIMHKLQKADCVARVWIGYWLCEAGGIGGIDSLLTYCTNEAWFFFHGHVNTQQQMAHNLRLMYEVL
jgi:hypothetical protein